MSAAVSTLTPVAPETRQLKVNARIIFDLIRRQSGTLGKAIAENVSNSYDAGAKNVWIEMTNTNFSIRDDGTGFLSREEILRVFEVLGFEHNDKERAFGKFGIGRAQAWSFADASWVSNGFRMDVDIEKRGLDYDLYEGLVPEQPGLLITGRFYEKQLTSELLAFEKEFAQLLRYAPLNVFLNGKQVNKDPASEKWDHDTLDAWIRVKATGELTVYNMGVLVRSYDAYHFGSGGVVVTKPGVNLTLNMARNDVINSCAIWKRLRKFLQQRSDERVRSKTTRMTSAEIENFTKRALAKEIPLADIADVKLFTDIQGRGHTLDAFVRQIAYPTRPCTVAPDGSRLGEQVQRNQLAFVLHPATLDRFGVDSVKDLQSTLLGLVEENNERGYECWSYRVIREGTFTDDLDSVSDTLTDSHLLVPAKDWTAEEKVVLYALRPVCSQIGIAMNRRGAVSRETHYRTLHVGVSDTADAWTDGRKRIVLERKFIEQARRGVSGFVAIMSTLVHEYLHDSADAGSHSHDAEFYQRFHDLLNDASFDLGQWAVQAFSLYVRRMGRDGLALRASVVRNLTAIEQAERAVNDEEADEAADAAERQAA